MHLETKYYMKNNSLDEIGAVVVINKQSCALLKKFTSKKNKQNSPKTYLPHLNL
jgi:hypothetical protein